MLACLVFAVLRALHPEATYADAMPTKVASAAGSRVARDPDVGLESILERRFLRVLTLRPPAGDSAGTRSGSMSGYQVVRAFTDFLNAKYPAGEYELPIAYVLIRVDPANLIPSLQAGTGDLIAAPPGVGTDRHASSEPGVLHRASDDVIVGHARAPVIASVDDLSGRPVAVRQSSVHHAILTSLAERLVREGKLPVRITALDPDFEPDDIVALVAAGHFQYTLTDSRIARAAAAISPSLRITEDLPLHESGELVWTTLPSTPGLAADLSDFLDEYRHGSLPSGIGVRRSFDHVGTGRTRLAPATSAPLSRYDAHFKRFADRYGFDWRLLASIACQESRFRQSVTNRWGATGLFQVKPKTAREPYIGIREIAGSGNAANNVHAGVRYLNWIKERYFDPVEEMRERDRIRMALAAYNAGPRTLLRAQRLANQMGLDPNRWFRNVELAMLAMDKRESVNYVREINQRHLSYVMFGVE